jgi:curved DNA-binding protein CbpA
VRIPLDYYRILGLPLAASDEQLRQAYGDRVVQLPRREYSATAISARKELIEKAYEVLSDPIQRSSYNQLYLAHAYTADGGTTPSENGAEPQNRNDDLQSLQIEITPDQFIGALLILQELGEYEMVLKLCRPHLVNQPHLQVVRTGHSLNLSPDELEADSELPDILLTFALACLELGREQWQQGHYESAATSLDTGLELISHQGLFLNLQGEIIADLYKLRPYRILELIALPEENVEERKQGLELLQSILEERGGIDGSGNDQSGLNIDDFLRFIQQLRYHLTVVEQHKLFEAESKRPSPVATYLAVYTLIARGFAQRQPALIRQAKQMLMRLGKRQDVHLEQSLCALLLGQTEEATRVLELSQEYEALAFIREKSLDSPDLLPGLCLYCEKWLQQEVFPHFRDLARQQASLKVYFADRQVQAYLEALPSDAEPTSELTVINRQSVSQIPVNPQNLHNGAGAAHSIGHKSPPTGELRAIPRESPEYSQRPTTRSQINPVSVNGQTRENSVIQETQTQLGRKNAEGVHSGIKSPASVSTQQRRRRTSTATTSRNSSADHRSRPPRRRRTLIGFLQSKKRLLLVITVALASLIALWLLISSAFGWLSNILNPGPVLKGEQLSIELNQPPLEIPDPDSQPPVPEVGLTNETAQQVISTWLSTKTAALGPNHAIDSLGEILTGPVLTQWRSIAKQEKEENRYRNYSHDVKVESVTPLGTDSEHFFVIAKVQELTQFYANARRQKSIQENLQVRYELIRKDGVWKIKSMFVQSKTTNPVEN